MSNPFPFTSAISNGVDNPYTSPSGPASRPVSSPQYNMPLPMYHERPPPAAHLGSIQQNQAQGLSFSEHSRSTPLPSPLHFPLPDPLAYQYATGADSVSMKQTQLNVADPVSYNANVNTYPIPPSHFLGTIPSQNALVSSRIHIRPDLTLPHQPHALSHPKYGSATGSSTEEEDVEEEDGPYRDDTMRTSGNSSKSRENKLIRTKDKEFRDALDDLSSRFIINLPESEFDSTDRVCFQIEQAHWYYEDFLREENSRLPQMGLKRFFGEIFQHCPILSHFLTSTKVEEIYQKFMAYKLNVPVCGAIILNEKLDKALLVKGWSARSSWGFPKGKINENEKEEECAIREVFEETSFNIKSYLKPEDHLELTIRGEQRNRVYIITGVNEANTGFATRTRKEISQIAWHKLSDLPGWKPTYSNTVDSFPNRRNEMTIENTTKYYLVKPFIQPLQNWLHTHRHELRKQQKRQQKRKALKVERPTRLIEELPSKPKDVDHGAEAKIDLEVKNMFKINAGKMTTSDTVLVDGLVRRNDGDIQGGYPLAGNPSIHLRELLGVGISTPPLAVPSTAPSTASSIPLDQGIKPVSRMVNPLGVPAPSSSLTDSLSFVNSIDISLPSDKVGQLDATSVNISFPKSSVPHASSLHTVNHTVLLEGLTSGLPSKDRMNWQLSEKENVDENRERKGRAVHNIVTTTKESIDRRNAREGVETALLGATALSSSGAENIDVDRLRRLLHFHKTTAPNPSPSTSTNVPLSKDVGNLQPNEELVKLRTKILNSLLDPVAKGKAVEIQKEVSSTVEEPQWEGFSVEKVMGAYNGTDVRIRKQKSILARPEGKARDNKG